MADIKDIRTILRDLHLVSGFRVSLHGTDFSEISAYPEEISPFCRLVQENPKAKMQCVYTDADAFERARHSGKIYIYRCRFGLCEAACPLYKNGVLSGYLMMGQVKDGLPGTDAVVISEALPYVSDRPELEKTVSSLSSVPREKMLALADIISLCADRLTDGFAPQNARDLAASAVGYINRNIGKKLTVDIICSAFSCSRSTLMKCFRRDCGMTVNEYIVSRRIDIAKELLQYSELPVSEIASKCGFSDQLYFSRVFSSRVGVPPTVFRKDPFGRSETRGVRMGGV